MKLLRLLKQELVRESTDWVKDGLINEQQAVSICQRYGADYYRQQRPLAYNALIILGYLFIGIALIILIGANWEEIPRWVRMLGLIALTATVHSLGLKRYFAGHIQAASGLFFLGNLFYGASIILIAQIYHLGEHMPDGVMWWALGSLPFAVLLRQPWLMLQTLILATIWMLLDASMGYLAPLYLLFLVASLFVLARGDTSIVLLLGFVFALFSWLMTGLSAIVPNTATYHPDLLTPQIEHMFIVPLLFIALHACSLWLVQRNDHRSLDYAVVLRLWYLRFGIFLLILLSFEAFWEDLLDEQVHTTLLLVLSASLSTAILWLAWHSKQFIQSLPSLGLYWLTLGLFFVLDDIQGALILAVIFNFALIATGIYLIWSGMQHSQSQDFFLGVFTLLLTALLRYFDLIGDYVSSAILFMVFAGLMLGAAKYWRHSQQKQEASQ